MSTVSQAASPSTEAKSNMGKVLISMTVTNRADEILAKAGAMPADNIRTVVLDNVLVDTGAMTLCLPAKIVEQLGLELFKTVDVATATGISQARVFQDARLNILGREGTFECLELPGGQDALVGVIPLEALGLEPDLRNQKLKVLPTESWETYLTIL